MIRPAFLACAFLAVLVPVAAALPARSATADTGDAGPRHEFLLDPGWRFAYGDAASVEGDFAYGSGTLFAKAGETVGAIAVDFADSTWRRVDLPHDWAVELDFHKSGEWPVMAHGYKPVGRAFPKTTIGWYRKSFVLPHSARGSRCDLRFDGVFRDCIVWLNGHYLGAHLSGYTPFEFDITDYVNADAGNVIVIRVDASQYEGWFYEGAGIYRHAWLITHAPVFLPAYGTFVTTTVAHGSATVRVATAIANADSAAARCTLALRVVDDKNSIVTSLSSGVITIPPGATDSLIQLLEVRNPRLWDLEHPHLYTLESAVVLSGVVADRRKTTFGIRTIRFDSDEGFFLNGKRVELRGVCCHQDHAGVGSALPDRLQEYRIEHLKEMGVNAYRTSHNPPTPELLDACDRLGMLVMDENRLLESTPEVMGQFACLVQRDRNHPSVIVWSLGNEEWVIQGTERAARIARALMGRLRTLDPSRTCTYAANNGNQFEGINSVIPVRGINYLAVTDIDKYHRDHPLQPLLGSEEASTLCTRGIYANDTIRGYVSDDDVNAPRWGATAERWWRYYADRPWLAGAFVWTGFDYRGEPTPYAWPCINSHFGVMDVCGFPKNNFYYYRSWWTDNDVLHLAPHWNWAGREGQMIDVWCQSNCDSVELSLNGAGLGTRIMPRNSHLEWNVRYAPGRLEARGWKAGRELRETVETTGEIAALRLSPDRPAIRADGEDVCVVNVTGEDDHGREVPVAGAAVHFTLTGPGRILGVGNGDPSSHEPDKCAPGEWERRLFNGKCQIILQAGRQPGMLVLRASAGGGMSAEASIRMNAARIRPYIE